MFLFGFASSAQATKHPYFSKAPQAEKQIEGLMKQLGFKVVEPQALDLTQTVTSADGSSYDMSQVQGKVVMLTRWATWCGACKAELPHKLALNKSLNEAKFALVGVSSEEQATIQQFQQGNNGAYPISLVDAKGQLQHYFPGKSIPTTLLIDGWGWLLGIKRGGANWNSPAGHALIKALVKLLPFAKRQTQEQAPPPAVDFPKSFKVKAGEAFDVQFTLRWTGENDKYRRTSIKLPAKVKGLKLLGMRTAGQSFDSQGHVRRYILKLQATQKGQQRLDQLTLKYWLKDYDKPFEHKLGGMKVLVADLPPTRPTNALSQIPIWAWGMLLGAILLLGLIIVVAAVKGGSNAKAELVPATAHERRDEQVEKLLGNSIGRLSDYLDKEDQLAAIEEVVWIRREVLEQEPEALEAIGEQMRYAGRQLNTDERRQHLLDLHNELNTRFPTQAARLNPYL